MLTNLKIENYALIRQMEIAFNKGFIAITGETGAGKSIMLGALGLVLGQRADTGVLWDKEKKCIVEAEFLLKDNLEEIFIQNDLDFNKNTLFRREINPNGKTRAFINDTPVGLNIMKEMGERLMDIHSQHNTLTLKNSDFQFAIVDYYIEEKDIFPNYHTLYLLWKDVSNKIKDLEIREMEFQKEVSYLEFLSKEFETANLQIGEQEELEEELNVLTNAEEIKTSINEGLNYLDNEEDMGGANTLIRQALSSLAKIIPYHKDLESLHTRLDSNLIELRDIISELINIDDKILLDKDSLDLCKERLDLIYNLEKKHFVSSLDDLLKVRDDINERLIQTSNLSVEIEELKTKEREIYLKITALANDITQKRRQAATRIEAEILPLLANMGMKEAVLRINISKQETLHSNGENEIEFLFNANKGGDLQAISKVISGGELSRLMLSLKAIMSRRGDMPTIIFDEIDTGVSGDIASKVGAIMKSMSIGHQLIAITHLPQIAARADYHYKVFKNTDLDTTYSEMKLLNSAEREVEIASIISNGDISSNALNLAKELIYGAD